MPTLTWDDLAAIQREVPSIQYAAPQLRTTAPIISEETNWTTSVTGTTPEYFVVRSWPTASGATFGPSDIDGATKVVVLGQTVVDKLFGPGADPVGQMVRIRNIPFQVVGVLARKGQSPMGQDYDDGVFIPSTTFMTKIQGGLKKYLQGTILASARSADATSQAQRQITALLRERHHLPKGTDDDFSIRNLAEMASAQQEGTKTMTTLLASIAAVSLLVGGIGIMNIMLVSVTERTREIGLRMAVGARRVDILTQFLVEALTLSIAGGIVGVALGLGVAQQLASRFSWPLLIRPQIIVIAVGFSRVRRHRVRAVSGAQGVAPRSDRGAAVRMSAPARRRDGRACNGGRRLARAGADGRRSDVARGAVARDRAAHRAPAAAAAPPGARPDAGGRGARRSSAGAAAAAGEPDRQLHARDEQLRATPEAACSSGTTRPRIRRSTTYNFFRNGLTATQLIWDFGQAWQKKNAARASAEAQEDTERATQLSSDLAIRSAFYQARAARDAVGVAHETLANQNKHVDQITAFTEVGTRPGDRPPAGAHRSGERRGRADQRAE